MIQISNIPNKKGVYVLFIHLNKDERIKIGKLGEILFKKGNYAYVGSAQNGLKQRINRHLSSHKKLFWHIDYFLNSKNTFVKDIFYKEANKSEECKIAKEYNKKYEPILNFGCSDCNCKSHFFKI